MNNHNRRRSISSGWRRGDAKYRSSVLVYKISGFLYLSSFYDKGGGGFLGYGDLFHFGIDSDLCVASPCVQSNHI